MAKGHMGLITSLAETCKKLSCRQAELVTHLMEVSVSLKACLFLLLLDCRY